MRGGLAPFGLTKLDGLVGEADGSSATQAGSHPYQAKLEFAVTNNLFRQTGSDPPAGDPKEITTNLPAGVIVNPNATPTKCTETQLESNHSGGGCPDSSAVGTVRVTSGLFGFPTSQSSALYNMGAPPGTPANLGFDALALGIYVHLRGAVRTGGDYGLSATASDILQRGMILGVSATLWGNPSDPSHDAVRGKCFEGEGSKGLCPVTPNTVPFLSLPTSCSGPLLTTLSTDSWQEPGNFVQSGFLSHTPAGDPAGVTGCGKLDFTPSLTVKPDTSAADSPSGLHVDLHLPQEESINGLTEAHLRDATVTLPAGLAVNPSSANGLESCSSAQIALSGPGPANCPDASKIGTVEVDTRLLDHPLPGAVYLAAQGDNPFGSLLAIYLTVHDPVTGVVIKLAGHVEADANTGQLTTTFLHNPQLPFGDLKLDFFGGPRAPLVTPQACGAYQTSSALTPWSGRPAATPSDSFAISSGPHGGPCPSGQFAPSFVAGTTNNQAGGFSPFSTTFSRGDGEQHLGGAQAVLPPGLLGVLRSVVQCPEPHASLGSCGATSLIGHTTVGAGSGTDPFYVGGNVFLTGPYRGAPFGLSIVVHALAGPFDLGNVIVRAAVSIDPHTAQATVTSDPLPRILQGIPLDLRTVNVTVDRPGFLFNPTNCAPLQVSGTLSSVEGAAAPVTSHFEAANCANLGFTPRFAVSTQARTSRPAGASLRVLVTAASGQANIGKVRVELPPQLPSRLTTLQKACVERTFASNPAGCPEGSVVGKAVAVTPLLAHPLSGPAILVSHAGAAFPDLVVVLQGEGITVDLTGNTKIQHGITSSTFGTVPDAPISRFDLELPEGPHSILGSYLPGGTSASFCTLAKTTITTKTVTRRAHGRRRTFVVRRKHAVAASLLMPTIVTGQNGAVTQQNIKIAVTGCPTPTTTRSRSCAGVSACSTA